MPTYQVSVTTTGSAGSASGVATIGPLRGFVDAVVLDYQSSAPATTDVTITESAFGSEISAGQTILTRTNSNTDGTFYPRHAVHDTTGTDTGTRDMFYIEGQLTISVSQCDPLDPALTVKVRVWEPNTIR